MARSNHRLLPITLAGLAVGSLLGCVAPRLPAPGQLVVEFAEPPQHPTGSVLYLEPVSDTRRKPEDRRLVEVASDGVSFGPPLTVVHVGDWVRFVNRGALAHRIFIADEQGRRERIVEPEGHSAMLDISRAGEHRFYCSLHPAESFMVFAAPSLHFAVLTGERVQWIGDIPAGRYQVNWWSEGEARSLGVVEIQAGERATHALSLASSSTSER